MLNNHDGDPNAQMSSTNIGGQHSAPLTSLPLMGQRRYLDGATMITGALMISGAGCYPLVLDAGAPAFGLILKSQGETCLACAHQYWTTTTFLPSKPPLGGLKNSIMDGVDYCLTY